VCENWRASQIAFFWPKTRGEQSGAAAMSFLSHRQKHRRFLSAAHNQKHSHYYTLLQLSENFDCCWCHDLRALQSLWLLVSSDALTRSEQTPQWAARMTSPQAPTTMCARGSFAVLLFYRMHLLCSALRFSQDDNVSFFIHS
jgi:hypothetical protein